MRIRQYEKLGRDPKPCFEGETSTAFGKPDWEWRKDIDPWLQLKVIDKIDGLIAKDHMQGLNDRVSDLISAQT